MIKLSILIPVWNQEELVVKCLDSIPRRDDLEVIIRDDGSTDATLSIVKQYKEDHPGLNLRVYANKKNHGFAYTMNRLIPLAKGEFFHAFGSDDYLYTEEYSRAIDQIGDADVAMFDIDRNDGVRCIITEANRDVFCGQGLRFIRTAFVEGIKYPEDKVQGSDWYFHKEMMARNPKEKYLNILAYHYNYPNKGSLCYRKIHGELL